MRVDGARIYIMTDLYFPVAVLVYLRHNLRSKLQDQDVDFTNFYGLSVFIQTFSTSGLLYTYA